MNACMMFCSPAGTYELRRVANTNSPPQQAVHVCNTLSADKSTEIYNIRIKTITATLFPLQRSYG